MTISFALSDTTFVLGIGEASVKAVLDVTPATALAADPGYQATMKAAGPSTNSGSAYVDLHGIRDAIEPLVPAAERDSVRAGDQALAAALRSVGRGHLPGRIDQRESDRHHHPAALEEGSATVAVRIRLTRVGSTKQPAYRVVVTDGRSARDGRSIETIGHYNPRSNPVEVKIDAEKATAWMAKGAQPSDTVARLFRQTGILPDAK